MCDVDREPTVNPKPTENPDAFACLGGSGTPSRQDVLQDKNSYYTPKTLAASAAALRKTEGTLTTESAFSKLPANKLDQTPKAPPRHRPKMPVNEGLRPPEHRPGASRLEGYETSTREAAVLAHYLEAGRQQDLQVALCQLLRQGRTLTEWTYLPLLILARHIGDAQMARAVLEFAQEKGAKLSERSFSETATTLLAEQKVPEAELVARMAIQHGLLVRRSVRQSLQKAGALTDAQIEARWRLSRQKLQESGLIPPLGTSPRILITRPIGIWGREVLWQPADRQTLIGPTARPGDILPTSPQAIAEHLVRALARLAQIHTSAKVAILHQVAAAPGGHERVEILLPAAEPPFCLDARIWHVELPAQTEVFQEPSASNTAWVPLDHAVVASKSLDELGAVQEAIARAASIRYQKPWEDPHLHAPTQLPYKPRALVACEASTIVSSMLRDTSLLDSSSCDLLPPEKDQPHLIMDATLAASLGWHLCIAHPPCRYLSLVSQRYLDRPGRARRLELAAEFLRSLFHAPAAHVAIEQPRHSATARRELKLTPQQSFLTRDAGVQESKPFQLYLKRLPPLQPVASVAGRLYTLSHLSPSPLRSYIRSRTLPPVARQFAVQWAPIVAADAGYTPLLVAEKKAAEALEKLYGPVGSSSKLNSAEYMPQRGDARVVAAAWARHQAEQNLPFPKLLSQMQTTQKLIAAATTAASSREEPLTLPLLFRAWKRSAELNRGRLFGSDPLATPPTSLKNDRQPLWVRAVHLLLTHYDAEASKTAQVTPEASEATTPLPLPPVRRVQRRNGSWWVWMPIAPDPSDTHAPDPEPPYRWIRLPPECNSTLDSTVEQLRPTVAAALLSRWPVLRTPAPTSSPTWRRLSMKLRARASGPRLDPLGALSTCLLYTSPSPRDS